MASNIQEGAEYTVLVTVIVGITALIVGAFAPSIGLHLVWNMLNELQLLVHLPLMNLMFPANVLQFYSILIVVA